MNYLVVVAHPDDEVLGAGATMYKLSSEGHSVNVCILSSQANARVNRPDLIDLNIDVENSMGILRVDKVISGNFPNIKFNNTPHLELVQFIERAIVEVNAEVIITHHPSDLNNDHLHTSLACQAASKLFQRNPEVTPLKELLFMETPSATDWALSSINGRFNPNVFIEVGEDAMDKKIEALKQYRGVMRDYPHPRSNEVLKGLSLYRGGQAGVYYAEAFECVFRRIV